MLRLFRRQFKANARFNLLLLLVLLAAAAVVLFSEVLLPFALAVFLAYLLAPVVRGVTGLSVRGRHMPRGGAVLLVYAVILGLVVLSGYFVLPRFYVEVNRMVRTLPGVLRQVEERYIIPAEVYLNRWGSEFAPLPETDVAAPLGPPTPGPGGDRELAGDGGESPGRGDALGPAADGPDVDGTGPRPDPAWRVLVEDYTYVVNRTGEGTFEVVPRRRREGQNGVAHRRPDFERQMSQTFAQLRERFEENFLNFMRLGREAITLAVSSFLSLVLVLMISGFILLDPERIRGFLGSLIPRQYHDAYDDWLRGLDRGLSGVVRGQAMICLVNGVLTGVGIAVLGVPFVITLSTIAAVFSLIPIFGVLISTVPILLMAITVSFSTAVAALVWILFIHFLEGNFLNPKILGDSAKIHPVLIIFALVVGEHFGGVLGALVAVPIFSLIQNSFLFLKQRAESLETAR